MNDYADPWDYADDAYKAKKEDHRFLDKMIDAPPVHDGHCPSCHKWGLFDIVDGPDPVFADVSCHYCGHVWNVGCCTEDTALGGVK